MTPPKFIYFDLGNVVVHFDHQNMFRQIAQVSGVDAAQIEEVVLDRQLREAHETGRISGRELYDVFCRRTGTRPDYDALVRAGSDIFELNVSLLPIISQIRQAGYRLGVLSNTCAAHWEHCAGKFSIIAEAFSVEVLSYRVGAVKPQAEIFAAAAEAAGCRPQEIFFTDDTLGHVAGARASGFDAVQYTSTPKLVADLRQRGVVFNY